MKIKLFMATILISSLTIPAYAGITPDEATSLDYLKNYGYSTPLAEAVQKKKARMEGQDYITEDEIKHANDSTFVKAIRGFFIYLDPALDDRSFMNHDSKPSPNIDDL